MSSNLCERCQRFDIQAFGRDSFPYRGVRLSDIVRSADHCMFCDLLLEYLQRSWGSVWIAKLAGAVANEDTDRLGWSAAELWTWLRRQVRSKSALFWSSWVNLSVTVGAVQTDERSDGLNLVSLNARLGSFETATAAQEEQGVRFHIAADIDTPASTSHDITGRLITGYPWTEDSPEAIKTWQNDCIETHDKCRKTMSGAPIENVSLPTRCIETYWETLGTDSVSLRARRHVLRETSSEPGQYITLSHRWTEETGQSRTTESNLDCRLGRCLCKQGHEQLCISTIQHIPQIFIDTCIVAHQLGINYVWTDSLCIVQAEDDHVETQDWKREAPNMARYYQNAWATVAAAGPIASVGLFGSSTSPRVPRIVRLPYRTLDGEVRGSCYLQPSHPDWLGEDLGRDVDNSELRQRGWVYQEWELSRRIIAFSVSGCFLYCHSAGAISSAGDHIVDYNKSRAERREVDQDFERLSGGWIPEATTEVWQDIVREYSKLGLTNLTEDRLVALAGIADEFGQIIKSFEAEEVVNNLIEGRDFLYPYYACGLWLPDLAELLWERALPGPHCRVPGFPTWSWASMASSVTAQDGYDVPTTGLEVRWAKFVLHRPQEVVSICAAVTIATNEKTRLPEISGPLPEWPKYEYGNDDRFVLLTLHGCLLRVYIEHHLSDVDADIMWELTFISREHDPYPDSSVREAEPSLKRPYGADLWRGVCLTRRHSNIAGWASLERPELQTDGEIASSRVISALLIERSKAKGSLFRWSSAPLVDRTFFTVVFVRRASTDAPGFHTPYEKVGMGALFGADVDKAYQSAAKTTISLI